MFNPTPVVRRRRTLRAVAASVSFALALGLIGASAVAQAANAADPGGVSLRPADSTGAFDGRNSFRYKADPGQTVQDYAAVVNTGTETRDFTVFGTDAFNDANGDFALLPTKNQPKAAGRWVTFENGANRMTLTLAPGEGRLVPFMLTVPKNATPGDHAAGVVASALTSTGQVQVDRRVAIRLYARVSGDLQPSLSVSKLSATYSGDWWNFMSGSVTLHYTLANNGNVALAANVDGKISTWFGIPLKSTSNNSVQEVLPGNSASHTLELRGISRWLYVTAGVRVNPFVDGSDVSSYVVAPPSSRDTILFAVPWTILIVLILLAGVIVLVVWRRRVQNQRAILWVEEAEKRVREETLAQQTGELQEASSRRD